MDDREDRLGRRLPARVLENIANDTRLAAGLSDEWTFDVPTAIWRLAKRPGRTHGLQIKPLPNDEMGNKEAWATANPPEITIKKSRCDHPNDPETRFILSHELFHVLLHEDGRNFRVVGGNAKLNFLSQDDLLAIYHNDQSIETQADVAARAFLMKTSHVREVSSPAELARRCLVPLKEAGLRFAQIHTAKKSPEDIRAFLAARHKDQRHELWNGLPTIQNENPAEFRRAGIWRIAWAEFGLMTECGWTIERGGIIAYFGIRAGRLGR